MTDNHTGIDTSAVLDELRDRSRELQATQWSSICGAPDCGISAALCDRAADAIEALSAELTAARECIANLEEDQERSEKVIADANEALAWQAGAEAMRGAAVMAVNATAAPISGTPYAAGGRVFADAIRALPIPDKEGEA